MKNGLLTMVLLTSFAGFGQQGIIEVKKDPRIDALVEKQGQVIPPEVEPQIEGYRIQLFFDQDKTAVNESRTTFINKYPTIDTYVEYHAPYFYLKVGDFRTHLEAVRIKSTVEDKFPTSFVVKEKIYLPPLEKVEIE